MNLVDAEAMVRAFLDARISPVKVHTMVPAVRPVKFVRAWRTGGSAVNRVLDRPQITVQAWDETTLGASALARLCRDELFNNYTVMPLVRGVEEISGLYFDADPGTGIPRYTFTVALSVRAKR
jgi:hypothetical protein